MEFGITAHGATLESRYDSMLDIYRFHNPDCKQKLLAGDWTPDTLREYGRDNEHCRCIIYLTGTTEDGQFYPRQSTKLRDWEAAEALVKKYDAKGKDAEVHGKTLEECVQLYLKFREKGVGKKTHGQYKLVLTRLKDYAEHRNKMFIRELTVDLCQQFITDLDMEENSKSTSAAKLKKFLKEAYKREWILKPLAVSVESPVASYEQGDPFTEEEVEKILAGALKLSGGVSAYAKYPKTFRLLLETMNETGMRCGDTIRYDPSSCVKSDLMWKYVYLPQKTRRDKKPKMATVYLTDRLKKAIDECGWMSKKYPFAYLTVNPKNDKEDRTTYMANEVYERMKSIGARCVDAEGKPAPVDNCRPHRFRDRFAVRLLEDGKGVDDVSALLNHRSVKVTEAHYAKWVEARRKRLESVFYDATKRLPAYGAANTLPEAHGEAASS